MPNRIIKETAFTSDNISALTDFQFRLWVGLITQADDMGRGDARPAIIKGRVFPLRERVTVKDVGDALHVLAAHSCVVLYEVGGRPYYEFPNWAAHQRVRDAKSKYPSPEDAESCNISPQVAAGCSELRQTAANCGEPRPESNPNPNPNPNPNTNSARAREKFIPPRLEDVQDYVQTQGLSVDPNEFWDYFQEGDWIDSRGNKVHNWKQKIRTWNNLGIKEKPQRSAMNNYTSQGDSYDYDKLAGEAMEKLYADYGQQKQ